jgi:hypothetical protein
MPGSLRAAFAAALLLALGGCASTIRISELLAEPGRYDGQTVQVEGTVTRSAGVLGIGGYELDDGTGQIFVVAQGTGVPAQGLRTKVKGTFEPIFSFGGRSVAAIVQSAQSSP